MASLLERLQSQLGSAEIAQLSRTLGADEAQVAKGVASALPLLVSGLAGNARHEDGARKLAGALDRDHDGGLLDQLGGFLSGGDTSPGAAILGHVFGGRSAAAAKGVEQTSGLSGAKASQLLALLAPIVLAALGKLKRERSLGPGDLGDLLGRDDAKLRQKGGAGDLLTSILDRDGDGSALDDALEMGAGLLGGLFKK